MGCDLSTKALEPYQEALLLLRQIAENVGWYPNDQEKLNFETKTKTKTKTENGINTSKDV